MKNGTLQCEYCGTFWLFETQGWGDKTGWSGFLESTVKYHRLRCKDWTPKQRLDFINRNEKRLKKKPNLHTDVYFDRKHPGLQDTKVQP